MGTEGPTPRMTGQYVEAPDEQAQDDLPPQRQQHVIQGQSGIDGLSDECTTALWPLIERLRTQDRLTWNEIMRTTEAMSRIVHQYKEGKRELEMFAANEREPLARARKS